MSTFQHIPNITDLSPELLCHILEFLPLKGILSVGMLCRKLSTAVNMHFRLCKSIDFCPDSVSGYMPSTITDDHMHALLKKCPLLETVYGLHPVKVERRRLRKRSSLTVPGIIEALNLCFHLKAVETSDLKLFEAIMQHIPQLEIIGHFQNRDGVFPPHDSQKLKLHPYPRVSSLHLIGVEVPELTAMPHLQHLHLQCVRFTKLQPFRAFLAQNLKSFVMKHCIGPAMSLRYLSLIIALSSSPNLRHLELVRVPLPGGLFQRAVEDSHRHNGFVNLRTLVIAGCKGVLEADLGHLMIVSSKCLQTLFIQPSLTKDSLFVSLAYAQCTFPSLRNLHLGYIDNFNYSGEWSNDALLSFGLAEIPDTPSSITDSGMKVISQLLPRIKSLSVSNCPHLMVMYQWMPGNNLEAWSELTDLTLQKCHCLQLSSFTVFVSLLPCIQVIILNEMFKEPPKGCSHVGLSAGTGLGMSSAVVSNQDEHIAVQGHQQEFDHPGEEENEEIEREIIEGDNEDNLEPHFMVLRGDFFEEDDDIVYIDYENRHIDEALQRQQDQSSSDVSSQSSDDDDNDVYFEGEYAYFPPPPQQMQLPRLSPPPTPQIQQSRISTPPHLSKSSKSNRSRRASARNVKKNAAKRSQYHLRQTPKRVQQSKSVGVQADSSLESKSADADEMSEDSADSGKLHSAITDYDPHKPSTSKAGRHLDYSYSKSSDPEIEVDFKVNENTRKSKKVPSNNESFSKKRKLSKMASCKLTEKKCSKFEGDNSSDSGYALNGQHCAIYDNGSVIQIPKVDLSLSDEGELTKPCSVVLTKIEDSILETDMSNDLAFAPINTKSNSYSSSHIEQSACDNSTNCSSPELKEVVSYPTNRLSSDTDDNFKCVEYESNDTESENFSTKVQGSMSKMDEAKSLNGGDTVLKSMSCSVHLTKIEDLCASTCDRKSGIIYVTKQPENTLLANDNKTDSKKDSSPSIEKENKNSPTSSVPFANIESKIISHNEESEQLQSKNKPESRKSSLPADHKNKFSNECNSINKESESSIISNNKYVQFPNSSKNVSSDSHKKEFSHCCVHVDKIKPPSDTNDTNHNCQILPNLNFQDDKISVNQYTAECLQSTKESAKSPKCNNNVPSSVICKCQANSDTKSENVNVDQMSFTTNIKRKKIQYSESIQHNTLNEETPSEEKGKFLDCADFKSTSSNQHDYFKTENKNISREQTCSTNSEEQSPPLIDVLSTERNFDSSESYFCNIYQQPSTSKGIKHNTSASNCGSLHEFCNISSKSSNQKLITPKFSSFDNSVSQNCYVKIERLEDEFSNSPSKTDYEKIKRIDCSSIKMPCNFVKEEDSSFKPSGSNNDFEDTSKFEFNSLILPEPEKLKTFQGETHPNIQPDYYIDISDNSLKYVKIVDSATGKSQKISNCKVLVSKIEDEKYSVSSTSVGNKCKKNHSDLTSNVPSVTFVEYNPYLPSTSSANINDIDLTCKSADLLCKTNPTNECKTVTKRKKSLYSSRHRKRRSKAKAVSNKLLNKNSHTTISLNDRNSDTSTFAAYTSKSEIDSECSQNVPEASNIKSLKIKNSDVDIILKRSSNTNGSLDINNNSFCKGIKIEETADYSENSDSVNFCIKPQCSSSENCKSENRWGSLDMPQCSSYSESLKDRDRCRPLDVPQCSLSSETLKNENRCGSFEAKLKTQGRRFSERIHNKTLATQRNSCISNESKEVNRPAPKRHRKKKTLIPMIAIVSQGTQANSADIRRSVRRIRRARAHRSVASSSYTPATGKISSKATSKKQAYKDYDPETLDKATSTSDPLLEDDAVQILQLSSDTLLSFTIVACGISDLTIDRCPKLCHLEVQACRILKRFEVNTCPAMRRLNISQCPKLGICELSAAVLSLSTDSYFLVTYEPCMQSYDPGDGEREVLSKAALSQSILICHDFYEPSDESIQATFRSKLLTWLHYMSRLHLSLNYTRGKSNRNKPEIIRSSEYPWSHDIRRIHGQYTSSSSEFCSNEGHYELLTNNPLFCDIFETYKIDHEFPSITDCEASKNTSLLSYEAIEKYYQMRKKFTAFYIPITKYNRTETYKLVSC